MDPLGEKLGDGKDGDIAVGMKFDRRAVGGDQFLDLRFTQSFVSDIGKNRMGNTGVNIVGAEFLKQHGGIGQGAGGFGEVIDHDDVFTIDVADDGQGLCFSGADASFRYNR